MEKQLWQSDGLGTDKNTLERVLRIFRNDGVQGIESQQALKEYIQKLDDNRLQEMHEIDSETALQLFADCFGVSFAARKYSKWKNDAFRKAIDILEGEKKIAEQEAEANRAELLEVRQKMREEMDSLQNDYIMKSCEKEEADQQIKKLRDVLAHYKADLFDFYARVGRVQGYE